MQIRSTEKMFKKFMTIALVTLLAQLICVKTTVVASTRAEKEVRFAER